MSYQRHADRLLRQIEATHGIGRLRALDPDGLAGPDMMAAVIGEARRLAENVIAPLDPALDAHGCRIEEGRVRTAPGHKEAWRAFVAGGWPTLDLPQDQGGQGLPLLLHSACEEVFNRASIAFGMLPTPTRAAARLLAEHGDAELKAEWLEKLTTGEWGATICISEPDAGSDVGRIRAMARPAGDGRWAVTGEKIWISFGDHDLTGRIGHCLLARTPDAPPGTRGLSLFLVPDRIDGVRNGVVTRRIEEKMGLHGSPTCALGFEEATGFLVGEIGRGLPQLFTMIVMMRISVGTQGAGLAAGAAEAALAYAGERRQGGDPKAPPVPIAAHGDVRRMLLDLFAREAVARGLVLTAALAADLGERESDAAAAEWHALLGWLLPLVKTLPAETAFDAASAAIQVMGGAGYTREWPVERHLRDARILAIYEGTSGMQAQDLLERRLLRDGGAGLAAFLRAARADVAGERAGAASALGAVLDRLERTAAALREAPPRDRDAAAYPFLQLAGLAATGWIALRLAGLSGDPVSDHLAACGRFWLADLAPRAALEDARIALGAARLDGFESL